MKKKFNFSGQKLTKKGEKSSDLWYEKLICSISSIKDMESATIMTPFFRVNGLPSLYQTVLSVG